MQRQAVPLLRAQRPMVGTGLEKRAARDSGMVVLSKHDGVVERVTGDEIQVRRCSGKIHKHQLIKYVRSNQDTCLNQKPIVAVGQKVRKRPGYS